MPRPPKKRTVECLPSCNYFKPPGVPLSELDEVNLSIDELEALRLKDRMGLDHEACAERMQVSRPTFHRILKSAHGKVARALTEGAAIRIEGGSYRLMGRHHCQECGQVWQDDGTSEPVCPECESESVVRAARDGHRYRRRGRGRGKRR